MGQTGVLSPDRRTELLEGEIFDMSPIGDLHAAAVKFLNAFLNRITGETYTVSVQDPIQLNNNSEPQPDLARAGTPGRARDRPGAAPEPAGDRHRAGVARLGSGVADGTHDKSRYVYLGTSRLARRRAARSRHAPITPDTRSEGGSARPGAAQRSWRELISAPAPWRPRTPAPRGFGQLRAL